jgi:predicted MFS family arabinose efflux permease
MMAIIFGGLPARLMFSSTICLFFPLYLSNLGFSQSSIGRNLMIFGIVTFAFSRLAAQAIENLKSKATFLLLLSILMIGFSILIPAFVPYSFAPELSIATYALGAVINTCSMMSIIEQVSIREFDNFTKGTLLSYHFIAERIGMILGPVVVSNLLNLFSFDKTMLVLGGFMIICSFIYGTYSIFASKFYPLDLNRGAKT